MFDLLQNISTEGQKSKSAFPLKNRNPKVPFHWRTEIVSVETGKAKRKKNLSFSGPPAYLLQDENCDDYYLAQKYVTKM